MANQPKNLGLLHEDKTGLLKHREWRGLKDTMYDYYRWLITWKDMIVMVLKAPVSTIKGLWNYRWMASYLAAVLTRRSWLFPQPWYICTHSLCSDTAICLMRSTPHPRQTLNRKDRYMPEYNNSTLLLYYEKESAFFSFLRCRDAAVMELRAEKRGKLFTHSGHRTRTSCRTDRRGGAHSTAA